MDERVRVLQLDTGREWRGGQQQVLYLTRELLARGHQPVIVAPKKSPLAGRAQQEGIPLREISYHGAGDPMAIRAILQVIQETGADLIHTHTAHAHSLGFLVRRLPGYPKDRKPCLIVHRRVDFPPSNDPLTRMRYTNDPCVTYLCVSDAVRLVLEAFGVAAERIRVVHSCVETARIDAHANEDRAALKKELGIPEDAALIGVIGAFVPHKGHRYLIDAMPRIANACPSAHLVLFGDGPLEADLRRQSWQQGLQTRVFFAGFRPDVSRFLHGFDLFAHPSTEEGLGTTILDAMAACLPVVASRAGGIPEIVRHGETGWLVPPAAPTELAGPIISLLQDPRRRAEFGRAGRARVEAEFSVSTLYEATLSAYRETLAARTAPPCSDSETNAQKA
jgi:glycosyltransferase involved in cell wall biosynthesis